MFFKDKLKLVKLPVSRILPNPAQPRKDFDWRAWPKASRKTGCSSR